MGIGKVLEIDGGPCQAFEYRPCQQNLGTRKILSDQADLANIRLRASPGDHRRQVLHLIGGDDRVVCLEVRRLGTPASGRRGSSDSPTKSGSKPTTLWPSDSKALASGTGSPVSRREGRLAPRVGDDREPSTRMGGQRAERRGMASPADLRPTTEWTIVNPSRLIRRTS